MAQLPIINKHPVQWRSQGKQSQQLDWTATKSYCWITSSHCWTCLKMKENSFWSVLWPRICRKCVCNWGGLYKKIFLFLFLFLNIFIHHCWQTTMVNKSVQKWLIYFCIKDTGLREEVRDGRASVTTSEERVLLSVWKIMRYVCNKFI